MLKKALMLTVAAGALSLASLPAKAGDISVSLGIDAYPLSTVIHYGSRPHVYYGPQPYYYGPPVVYAPPRVIYRSPRAYHRMPHGHARHWDRGDRHVYVRGHDHRRGDGYRGDRDGRRGDRDGRRDGHRGDRD